jgi:carboxypeptidase Q
VETYGTQRGWVRGNSHIDLVSPRTRTLKGTLLARSPGTGKPGEADVVFLPSVSDSLEFSGRRSSVRGKFVLTSPPERSCRPDEDFVANATSQTLAKIRTARAADSAAWKERIAHTGYTTGPSTGSLGKRLEDAGAAGIIIANWQGGWGVEQVLFTENRRAPALVLSCEDYSLLFRLAEHNQHPVVRVNADAREAG